MSNTTFVFIWRIPQEQIIHTGLSFVFSFVFGIGPEAAGKVALIKPEIAPRQSAGERDWKCALVGLSNSIISIWPSIMTVQISVKASLEL